MRIRSCRRCLLRSPLVAVVTAAVLLIVPLSIAQLGSQAPADAQEVDDVEEQLESTAEELAEARATFERAMADIAQAERELAAIEGRIADRAAELGAVDRELNAAQAVYDERQAEADAAAAAAAAAQEDADQARTEADAAAAVVADAEEEVADAEVEVSDAELVESDAVGQLEARVIDAFKSGSTVLQFGYVQGLMNAGDWHEVAVTASTFSRVLANDRDLVDNAERGRASADAARNRAERAADAAAAAEEAAAAALTRAEDRAEDAQVAKAASVALAEEAAEELVEVEAIREQRVRALRIVQAERANQEAIYRRLEQDAQTMQALQTRLNEQLETLQARLEAARSASSAGPVGGWSGALPAAGQEWAAAIDTAARNAGIDPRLFAALVWAESGFRQDAVSPVGAIGLAQLMPGTAEGLGVDPWVPEENLDGGARYLAMRINQTGSVELGLAAYNAGIGAVNRYGGIPPFAETQMYVIRVLDYYERLGG